MMDSQVLYPPIGLVVGLVVGLTGVGGGSLMTPILVFVFRVPINIAVGTDLAFASLTKIVGVTAHNARGNIAWPIVGKLAAGSIPASIVTTIALGYLRAGGRPLEGLILPVLGLSLVGTAIAIFLRPRILAAGERHHQRTENASSVMTVGSGVVLGVVVTLTSVGAGAIGTAMLMLLYPLLRPATVVGSDLAHAIPLLTVAGLGHLQLGNIDYRMLAGLLLGSVPGIYIGSTMSSRLPDGLMRNILAGVLLVMGITCVLGG